MANEQGVHEVAEAAPSISEASKISDIDSNPYSSTETVKDAIYKHCASQPQDIIFSQADLLNTGIIPDRSSIILQNVTSSLTHAGHLRLMETNGVACWRFIPSKTQKALDKFDPTVKMVYSYVESAGREGIWMSTLRHRAKIHGNLVASAIKKLEKNRLIKDVVDYRCPNRKTYMVYGLQPVEKVTGGAFYETGNLDEEYIRLMSTYIEKWIIARSWWVPKDLDDGITGKKRKAPADDSNMREDLEHHRAQVLGGVNPKHQKRSQVRPFPPGYSKYPSVGEMTNALNDCGISKVKMRIADIQLLVDNLVWDGKLERFKRKDRNGNITTVYKATRNVSRIENETEAAGTSATRAMTEAPCGRCPVFEFCEEGGLVNARTCPYFQQWLGF